jgi:type II secretory pathway component PulF
MPLSLEQTFSALIALAKWVAFWFTPLAVVAAVTVFLLSLPLRRQERARFFLDLLETGLASGRSPEHTLVSIAESRDVSVGPRFHLLAAHARSGHRLSEALEKVPALLPPQVAAVLRVGQEVGDVRRVLPGCRRMLEDGLGRFGAAVNYQILVLFTFNPLVVLVAPYSFVQTRMVLGEVLSAFGVQVTGIVGGFITWNPLLSLGLWIATGLLLLGAVFFLGGPRFPLWLQAGFYPVADWLAQRVPWRRNRLQRDFSSMLAILLDAEVPEDRALALAAESTANVIWIARAERVAWALRQGLPLTEAAQTLDPSGEFRWRLTNAARAQKGFVKSLAGWHEALDARAFEQEQSAAQLLSTLLVLLNGAIVAGIGAAIWELISRMGAVHSGL